ncbi:MAG: enoyl-CoA hydratase/isomerase family protein, partial [Acidimicrobiia bacterium]
VLALHGCSKPTVAAVEGFAVGAGWSLVLACDLVVAAEGSFFAAPFLSRGLLPDAGAGWFLPRALGPHRAAEFLFLGDRLTAERAAELGLVNRLVEPGRALEEALDLATRLADGPPNALGLAKGLLRSGQSPSLQAFLEAELLAVALNSHGSEVAEGRSAFLERREPRFRRLEPG